jgi:hypothetical protein
LRILTYNEGDKFVITELSIINQLLSDSKLELDYYKDNKVKSYGIQATEKLWGALAHMIRLNQYLLGKKIPTKHSENILFMKDLVTDRELLELRKRANKMHQRFYTGNFTYEGIVKDYEYVLRKKNDFMKRLRTNPNG